MDHYLLPQILHWSGRALWSSELASAKTRGFHTQLDEGPETP